MKPEWKAYLEDAGAEFDEQGVVTSFGSLQRELSVALTGNVFSDLSHMALISVHGKDAQDFLQGQLTNDVREVDAGHSQLTAYCSPKGRMLALFRLFRIDDSFYLSLPESLVEAVLKRLRMFVLRSDVTLEEVTDTFVHLGVSGPEAPAELEALAGEVPGEVDAMLTTPEYSIIRIPGVEPRFEIYGTLDACTRIWESLNVRCAPVGAPAWGLLNVLAGVPQIHPETVEAFVPQMANLHLLHGVSFKKGCYTGQEVVARMQYLGKLKRRMYLAHVETDQVPAPGTEIFSEQDQAQAAGKVVEAHPHPDGGCMLLAVIQIERAEKDRLHLGTASGPTLELRDLPYPFDTGQTK